jgi:hypothetical protein
MIPYQIFILLAIFNLILFCAGFFAKERQFHEDVFALFISFILSLYLALQCYGGISVDAAMWADGYVGLLFAGIGVVSFLMAIVRVISILSTVLQDPDYFDKKLGGY